MVKIICILIFCIKIILSLDAGDWPYGTCSNIVGKSLGIQLAMLASCLQ